MALVLISDLDGHMLLNTGRGAETLNPRQLCNVVYSYMTRSMDSEQLTDFRQELDAPLDPMEQAAQLWKAQGWT